MKKVKLFINLFTTTIIFNYFISILVLLLNPHVVISYHDFFSLYVYLFIFYGPLWFIFIGILFFIIQFFSEKKYPLGIFSPPTITYFLSFTILIVSFLLYLNYVYYFEFFTAEFKSKFVQILLVNLILIITSILFVVIKQINKKWIQLLFLLILVFNILSSFYSVVVDNFYMLKTEKEKPVTQKINPRKMRIVIMDGLSLNFLFSLSEEQKLLNFDYLIKNGVRSRISTFKPNFELGLLNSTLTGRVPSEYKFHSNYRFKISDLDYEFNIFPRYIFFRYSSRLGFTTFYKKSNPNIKDYIIKKYQQNNLQTMPLVGPQYAPPYSKKKLEHNSLFIHLFSDILETVSPKYEIVRKSFFLDDFIKNRIPDLKDTDIFYSITRLKGLDTISKYFYQYYLHQIFGNIYEKDINQYGWIIKKYYEYYDSIIGNLISSCGENELLVILSFFEYEPLPVWRRIIVNLFGQKDVYVYKSLKSQGTLLMYEKNALKKDYPLKTTTIFDIFPTLIYYSGFQLSKDLKGEVVREIFTDEFILNNPIDFQTN
ncbi:MAG: alkaline phosphatase family protein [Candidatus Aminicenantes bacterium]|nr:alkaline phosphatase family protein [Candidatus Aminicenantes bacterium]